jgi:branched-chain amino acid transport system substrate-binding protein
MVHSDMSRRLTVSLILAAIVVAGAAAAWQLRPQAPLRLGLVGSLSGRFAVLGTTGRDGAILAVEEINAAGGIDGRQVSLDIQDDRGDGAACRQAYESLASRDCRLVIGPFATGPATAALETINRLEVLTLAPTVAGDNFTGQDDWFLRFHPSTRAMGRMLGSMAMADGVRVMAVIGDAANGPFVSTTIAGVREAAGQGVRLIERSFDSRQRESLLSVASEVAEAEAVLLVASSLDTAALAQRLRAQQADLRLLCASWSVSKELIANGGRSVDGMRTVLPVDFGSETTQALGRRFKTRFGEDATFVAVLHHGAVLSLAAAIRSTGSTDPMVLRRAMTAADAVPGTPPGCRLDRFGDPCGDLVPHRIVDGRLVAESKASPP